MKGLFTISPRTPLYRPTEAKVISLPTMLQMQQNRIKNKPLEARPESKILASGLFFF